MAKVELGRRSAAAYILASIAREVLADRKAAGLSQQELARRAGIRQETLSRIESGKHTSHHHDIEANRSGIADLIKRVLPNKLIQKT